MPVCTFFRAHLVLWCAYVVSLVVLSLMPVEMPPGPDHADKFYHCAAYAVLAMGWPFRCGRSWLTAFGFATALGLGLEAAQGVLPTGRFADPWDAVANTLGAAIGVLACLGWERVRTKKLQAKL